MHNNVILYDGICNLCNGFVQFVIKHDTDGKFKFASLQSEYVMKLFEMHNQNLDKANLASVFLLKENVLIKKSSAAIEISRQLGGLWEASALLYIIPSWLRDYVYDLIAKNRYKWFGKTEECWLPTKELKSKFIQ